MLCSDLWVVYISQAYMAEVMKTQLAVEELSGTAVRDCANIDLAQPQAPPISKCIAFVGQCEEVMCLLKEKIHENEMMLTYVQDYERHYEVYNDFKNLFR